MTKVHAQRPGAFVPPEFGPLVVVEEGAVRFFRSCRRSPLFGIARVQAQVELIKVTLDQGPLLLEAAVAAGVDGIVLEALGGGHVPLRLVSPIERAIAAGIPVVISSRCLMGRPLRETYAIIGGEAHLQQIGAIYSPLSGPKTRIRLALALSGQRTMDRLRDLFDPHDEIWGDQT